MIEKLMELGFAHNEAKVYLALVKLGTGSPSDITKESGVHRVNVYEVLDKLSNKGLVSSLRKGTKKVYSVGEPQNLLRFVQQKEMLANEIVPQLQGMYNMKHHDEDVFYFTGPEGLLTAYYMMLDENAPILYGLGGSGLNRKILKHRHKRFNADRIAKGMKVKAMYYESARAEKTQNPDALSEVRFLPEAFKNPAMIDIAGNVVVIILATDTVRAIVIKNKDIAEAYKKYFEFMWQFATP